MTIHTIHCGPAFTISLLQMIGQSWEFARDLLECRFVKRIGQFIRIKRKIEVLLTISRCSVQFCCWASWGELLKLGSFSCVSIQMTVGSVPSKPYSCVTVEKNAMINEGRLTAGVTCGGKNVIKAFSFFAVAHLCFWGAVNERGIERQRLSSPASELTSPSTITQGRRRVGGIKIPCTCTRTPGEGSSSYLGCNIGVASPAVGITLSRRWLD